MTIDVQPTARPSKILLRKDGRPPELTGSDALKAYLLMLLQSAIEARDQVPEWSAVRLVPDRAVFRTVNQAKDTFWLRYGAAAGGIDVARATKQIDEGLYEKLRGKLTELLLSTGVRL